MEILFFLAFSFIITVVVDTYQKRRKYFDLDEQK